MPKVYFVETRQIRRRNKTVRWCSGETYDYDPEMEPMIKIGHARIIDDESAQVVAEPAKPEPTAAKKDGDALLTRTKPNPAMRPAERREP